MSLHLLPLATAVVAGFAHALEADHVAAVTTFVARRPHPMRALGFGVRWGAGHALALFLLGGAVILLDVRLSLAMVGYLEATVGVVLIALGLWALGGMAHRRVFGPEHRLAHVTGHSHRHPLPHGSTWVGLLHGGAGTAGLVAILPISILPSPLAATGYLLLFGIGTVLAMGLYALLAGLLFHRAAAHAPTLGIAIRIVASVASVAVGTAWLIRSLA